jgi:hypothetical protein
MIQHDTDHEHQNDVYRCQDCGSLWPDSGIAQRPLSRTRYCRTCNGGVRLCVEELEQQQR